MTEKTAKLPNAEIMRGNNILKGVKELVKERKHLYGAAILDDENHMIGSIPIVDYPSKEILKNGWLNKEPYVTEGVWQEIDIKPCGIPDFFLDTSLA